MLYESRTLKNNYVLIKNFISPEAAKELARRYKNLQEEIGFEDDDQVSNAPSWSNSEIN